MIKQNCLINAIDKTQEMATRFQMILNLDHIAKKTLDWQANQQAKIREATHRRG